MAWLDALLGALFNDGDELEILGGLNFKGFNVALNEVVNSRGETVQVYDIEVDTAGLAFDSDDITNESGVTGDSVTEALDALAGLVSGSTAAGSAGALQASDGAGAFADSGVTATTGTLGANVINVGNGTIGTGGDVNFEAAFSVYAKNTAAGSSRMFGWGGADFSLGDATWSGANAMYYDCGPTGAHVFRNGTSGNWCTFDIASSRKRMNFADDATLNVPSGKTFLVSVNSSTVGTWSATGLALNTLALSGASFVAQNGTVVSSSAWLRANRNGVILAIPKVSDDSLHKILASDSADNVALGSETVTNTLFLEAKSGGTIVLRTNSVTSGTFSATGLAMNTLAISGVTTLNGARVAAPTQGTAITTTATVNVSNGVKYDVSSAGGAYAITLGTSGTPLDGETVTFRTTAALANDITVTNGGTGGGNLGPSGKMAAGTHAEYYYYYDGATTAWKYGGYQRTQ